MKQSTRNILIVAVVGFWAHAVVAASNAGNIDFPTSTRSEDAQAHFLRGAVMLHSFGWKQAIAEFKLAQAADPDLAMAYWGEAMCHSHPLDREPGQPEARKVLNQLGPDLAARLAKAPTDRERGFLLAAEALFFAKGNLRTRRAAHRDAMRELSEANPHDDEVAAFYALSLLSYADAVGNAGQRARILAGSIALGISSRNPNHPGAAHYAIHAFDDPVHAPLALPAARKFASIAPAVAYARHMPSHIFLQLGMWEQVAASNESSYEAAVSSFSPDDYPHDMVRAADWGQYGDLQLGDYERAKTWIERMEKIAEQVGDRPGIPEQLARMKARLILESRQWRTQPVTADSTASELLATGISAVELGELAFAERASKALAEQIEEEMSKRPVYARRPAPLDIMEKQLVGAILMAKGQTDTGLATLAESVNIEAKTPVPRGPVLPLKPAHEFYAEALLAASRPGDAEKHFKAGLLRTPNRSLALLGLARSYTALGDQKAASAAFRRLADVWQGRDFPALRGSGGVLAGPGEN